MKTTLVGIILTALLWSSHLCAQESAVGEFTQHGDIGEPAIAGTAMFDEKKQTYELHGAGTNMWAETDEFHFVWKKMTGDFILRANANFIDEGADPNRDPHRKIGWIVRSTLEEDSPYIDIAIHGDGSLTSMQFRRTKGEITEQIQSENNLPDVIQLSRTGNNYTAAVANKGNPLSSSGAEPNAPLDLSLDLGVDVYVGLFICSHNPSVLEKAVFSNVRISVPAAADFRPYRDYIGSRLELLDVETGHRQVIATASDSIQAPNWTVDGKQLIYNRNGKLYTFNLQNKSATELDTGEVVNNNNDHVLSFDGKQLGISSSTGPDRKSTIFTLPVTGGTPKQVTSSADHSYLHSWTPDGLSLIFTGQRNAEFDIFQVPVTGGEETNLTATAGLDDGAEITPDGKTIYFNSSRTGKMQIWKMNADGTEQTQVTDDEYNNWFPHIAPDGKSFVYIAFPADIDPNDHPFYKHVTLRHMPIEGGPAKVLAYVYGGQGTMNVPSWSPDGKQIAFVSNSAGLSDSQ